MLDCINNQRHSIFEELFTNGIDSQASNHLCVSFHNNHFF